MTSGLIIAAAVTGGIVVLLVGLKIIMAAIAGKLEKYVRDRFDPSEIVGATTRANFFGRQSKGGRQIRGNGALVLTRDRLCFIMALPLRELAISLKAINHLSLPKSFNGRSVFAPLLCIHFQDNAGEDAMAWSVKNPQQWKATIEAAMQYET